MPPARPSGAVEASSPKATPAGQVLPRAAIAAAAGRRRYRRGRIRQLFLATADIAAAGVSLGIASAVEPFLAGTKVPALAIAAIPLIWVAVLHLYGLYPRFPRYVTTSTLNEFPKKFHAILVSSAATWVWLALWGGVDTGSGVVCVFFSALIALPVLRTLSRKVLTAVLGPERVVLVGTGSTTPTVRRALEHRSDTRVVDHVAVPGQWVRDNRGEDTLPLLEDVVFGQYVDRVLLSTRELSDTAVGDFLHWSRRANVSLTVLPEHFDVVGMGSTLDAIQGATVISLQSPTLSKTARLMKRGMDIIGAGIGLVLLLPVMLVIALAVRLDSAGSVIFRQDRVGLGGRRFGLVKFRTMVPDADAMVDGLMAGSSDPNWLQLQDDPRVTRVGRVLRSTSLDELPQLWNVLRGHMSLVGPRPLSVRDDARVGGWARGRLDLIPGLTGLWQVLGRKSVPFDEMVKIDYVYVNNWSLWGDIKLLLQTLPAVLRRDGAR